VVERYGNNGRVVGFQVWNEPNQANQANSNLGLIDNAAAYVELLKMGHHVIRATAPTKLIVSAATTSINQNYPGSLDYNRAMRDAGAQEYMDIWAIHYYGKQYENLVRPDGVRDFVNGLSKPIWVTESGAQGVSQQLAYGEEVWPYLKEKIPSIERIYQASSPDSSYGLRNLSGDQPVSDLYVWLRDR
jgi:O-glycosyl hydrolase